MKRVSRRRGIRLDSRKFRLSGAAIRPITERTFMEM
jgi:hypothetical protein